MIVFKKWFLINLPIFMFLILFSSFTYSIYKMQVNQSNQTKRQAGFKIMQELNALQLLIDTQYYVKNTEDAYVRGWSNVLFIDDMGFYFEEKLRIDIHTLHQIWKKGFKTLDEEKSNTLLSIQINSLRIKVKNTLLNL